MSDGEDNVAVVGRRTEDRGGTAEESAETQKALQKNSPQLGLVRWIESHPRAAFAVLLAALTPYLIICVGLALAFARIMTVGTCGG